MPNRIWFPQAAAAPARRPLRHHGHHAEPAARAAAGRIGHRLAADRSRAWCHLRRERPGDDRGHGRQACAPLVRVAWTIPWLAKPLLDGGAIGVVFPMVRTATEARERLPPAAMLRRASVAGDPSTPGRWGLHRSNIRRQRTTPWLRPSSSSTSTPCGTSRRSWPCPGSMSPHRALRPLDQPGQARRLRRPGVRGGRGAGRTGRARQPGGAGRRRTHTQRARQQAQRGYRFIMLAYNSLIIDRAVRAFLAEATN